MSTFDGMPRASAPAPASRHLVRRMVVVPAALGTAIALTVAGSAIAHPSEGSRAVADGAVVAAAFATPAAFGGLYAAPAANPARDAESVAAQAAVARSDAAQAASRQAAERSAISLAQGSKDERERAIATEKRDAAAVRKAARLKARRLAAAHRWVLPIKHPLLTSHFGFRWGRLHAGLDFGTPVGTSLFAMSSGVVTKTGDGGGYGNKIEITYWDGTVSYFAHMSEIDVKVGQNVRPGTYVGKSGNTGHSTGPHLHLEIHPAAGDPIDPLPWLKKHGINVSGV